MKKTLIAFSAILMAAAGVTAAPSSDYGIHTDVDNFTEDPANTDIWNSSDLQKFDYQDNALVVSNTSETDPTFLRSMPFSKNLSNLDGPVKLEEKITITSMGQETQLGFGLNGWGAALQRYGAEDYRLTSTVVSPDSSTTFNMTPYINETLTLENTVYKNGTAFINLYNGSEEIANATTTGIFSSSSTVSSLSQWKRTRVRVSADTNGVPPVLEAAPYLDYEPWPVVFNRSNVSVTDGKTLEPFTASELNEVTLDASNTSSNASLVVHGYNSTAEATNKSFDLVDGIQTFDVSGLAANASTFTLEFQGNLTVENVSVTGISSDSSLSGAAPGVGGGWLTGSFFSSLPSFSGAVSWVTGLFDGLFNWITGVIPSV